MKNLLVRFSSLLVAGLLFASCTREDTPNPAKILFAHASPALFYLGPNNFAPITGPTVDIIKDNRFVTIPSTGIPYGQPLITTYYDAVPGNNVLRIAPQYSNNNVYSRLVNLEAGKKYTAVALDFLPSLQILLTEDDLTPPAPGKAHLRFVHAIPQSILAALGAPRKDTIDIRANGNVVFATRSFGDGLKNPSKNAFVPVDAGTYSVTVTVAGIPVTIAGPLPLTLQEGKIYTVVARLNVAATPGVPSAGVTLIQHN
jgi:Domain of unknown function (DUF4397)